jgi:type IV pilus assembly protein PilP
MIMTARHTTTCTYFALTALLLCGLVIPAHAQESKGDPAAEQVAAISIKESSSGFEYQIEGRSDPFLPFISEQATNTAASPDEIVEDDQVLTGMQLFEPGQLTLVGLMLTGGNKFAMVQDFTGKGYIIEEGTKIGRRGVVVEIAENKVVISETARTRGGKVLTNKIAMALKKEGEE